MAWLYEFFTTAGVAATPASWGVVIVTVLCIYSILKLLMGICK
jgi:uncharacterized MnhB-related membrane protein